MICWLSGQFFIWFLLFGFSYLSRSYQDLSSCLISEDRRAGEDGDTQGLLSSRVASKTPLRTGG